MFSAVNNDRGPITRGRNDVGSRSREDAINNSAYAPFEDEEVEAGNDERTMPRRTWGPLFMHHSHAVVTPTYTRYPRRDLQEESHTGIDAGHRGMGPVLPFEHLMCLNGGSQRVIGGEWGAPANTGGWRTIAAPDAGNPICAFPSGSRSYLVHLIAVMQKMGFAPNSFLTLVSTDGNPASRFTLVASILSSRLRWYVLWIDISWRTLCISNSIIMPSTNMYLSTSASTMVKRL